MVKSFLDHALELAALGFNIIPVTPGKKQKPLRKVFWNHASTDPEVIRRLWKCDPISGVGTRANPAISTTWFRDGALLVLDVDPKHGGYDSLDGLRYIMGYDLPDTYEQHTPSGGRHYVYFVPKACAGSNGKLDRGLDIKSHHNYILGAGAETAAGVYAATIRPVAPAPDWLVQWALAHPANDRRSISLIQNGAIGRKVALRKSHAYLGKLEPAPDGKRDGMAYRAACKLRGFGLSQADTVEQLGLWFKYDEGSTPFGTEDIEHATESAFKYAQGDAGEEAAESYFKPITDKGTVSHKPGCAVHTEPGDTALTEEECCTCGAKPSKAPESASAGQETVSNDRPQLDPSDTGDQRALFNEEHAFIMVGNKARVMWETTDRHGRPRREFLAMTDFHDKYAGCRMPAYDGNKMLVVSKEWVKWHARRSYDGVVFAPGQKVPSRYYNTWKGFAYQPLTRGEKPTAIMKEALAMFKEHTLVNCSSGNKQLAGWLTAFSAHSIQKPQEKPLVAVVFKGGRGSGKSSWAQRVGALHEPHLFVASDQRYLIGNFNGHMAETTWFVLEEAFWGGSKSAESTLKELVTGEKLTIEQKFREAFRTENYMRISIIGNEDWQVPAALKDERRWAVFDVEMRSMPFQTPEDKKKVRNYFRRMRELMEQGGYRYLLTYLQNFDLEDYDVNEAPVTRGLVEQIEHTLSPLHQWWMECLRDGRIVEGDFQKGWPRDCPKERIRDAFTRYCDRRNIDGRLPSAITIGKDLHKVCPSMLMDKKSADNEWVYRFPPLPTAREEWAKTIGRTPVWPDDEEV